MRRQASLSLLAIILSIFSFSQLGAAPLQNGDFTTFAGWSGEKVDSFSFAVIPVDPASDPNFSLLGGGFASLENEFDFFALALGQTFDLPSASGSLKLGFDYSYAVTDIGADLFQVALVEDLVGLVPLPGLGDLFLADEDGDVEDFATAAGSGSVVVDVTAFAGQTIAIDIFLSDGDFNEADRFDVGNIVIQEVTSVPIPSTLWLLGVGALLFRLSRNSA